MNIMQKTLVAFDVNGTLTKPEVRELFKLIDRSQCHLIVWSTLGIDYAKEFCQKYNLEADEYLDKDSKKVDLAIDDLPQWVKNAKMVLGVK